MDVLTHSNISPTDNAQAIQLPPISSFDSLIKSGAKHTNNSRSGLNTNGNANVNANVNVNVNVNASMRIGPHSPASSITTPINCASGSYAHRASIASIMTNNSMSPRTSTDHVANLNGPNFNDSSVSGTPVLPGKPNSTSSGSGKGLSDNLLSYQFGSTGSSPSAQAYRASVSLSHSNSFVLPHDQSQSQSQAQSQQTVPKLNAGFSNLDVLLDQNGHNTQVHQFVSVRNAHSLPGTHQIIPPIPLIQNHSTSSPTSCSTTSSSVVSTPSVSTASSSITGDVSSSSSLLANDSTAKLSTGTTSSPNMVVKKQPRKKKQCPLCGLFFSNLSTHKSTHLSPETRPFKCEVCSRGFARSNDLIRHKKLHWKDELNQESMDFVEKLKCLHELKGTYKCPFNSNLINLDLGLKGSGVETSDLPFETSNCHSTGIFSRCDTFKNHLKALHFEYPPGTKKKDRSKVAGHCKHCGQKFDNIEIRLKNHVGKECGYNFKD